MNYILWVVCIGLLTVCPETWALVITKADYNFTAANVRDLNIGGWNTGDYDLTEGTGKKWSFALPNTGEWRHETYTDVSDGSGWEGSTVRCNSTWNEWGMPGGSNTFYSENDSDFFSLGYTGAPNTYWNPPIPNGLPHWLGKTWQGHHSYGAGSYDISSKVIASGTLTCPLGEFDVLLVKIIYSGAFSYSYYSWETAEYGITVNGHTINGGKLYVLKSGAELQPKISVEDDSLMFGEVYYEGDKTLPFGIANNGTGNLSVTDVTFDVDGFSIATELPLSVPRGDTAALAVKYTATDVGVSYGTMSLFSNDKNNPQVDVYVEVRAVINPASAGSRETVLPTRSGLSAVYPNPFNSSATIRYRLDRSSPVRVTINNLSGEEIATLTDGAADAGEHLLRWDGANSPSGLYLVKLQTPTTTGTAKVVLIR